MAVQQWAQRAASPLPFALRGPFAPAAAAGARPLTSLSALAQAPTQQQLQHHQYSTLTKYGKGGRSSISGLQATIFGASGFIGRYLVSELGNTGTRLVVPYRGDPWNARHLKVCGDLGQVNLLPRDCNDEDAVRAALAGSDVVVNMLGRDYSTYNYKAGSFTVEAAARVAKLAAQEGVSQLIHTSAMGAGAASPSPLMQARAEVRAPPASYGHGA